jgi:hypothetical protein
MGNSHANAQKSVTEQQPVTYTQVTIKDLNNLIYNKKLKTEEEQNKKTQEENLEKEKIMQETKEYLYKIDVGKLLINAANRGHKNTIIIRQGYYYKNKTDNCYKHSECNAFSNYYFNFEITKEHLESLLKEYKTFVTDVLKLNVNITLTNDEDVNFFMYKATWE